MNTILEQYADKINGTFSLFDRMIIKGYIFQFFSTSGKKHFLSYYDNSFFEISDLQKAQELADQFDSQKLCRQLDHFAQLLNPYLDTITDTFHQPTPPDARIFSSMILWMVQNQRPSL